MNRRDLLTGMVGMAGVTALAPLVPLETLVQPQPLNPFLFTASLEGNGLVIRPCGLSIEKYLENPLILWNHDPGMQIGKAKRVSLGRLAQEGIAVDVDILKDESLYKAAWVLEPIVESPVRGNRGTD